MEAKGFRQHCRSLGEGGGEGGPRAGARELVGWLSPFEVIHALGCAGAVSGLSSSAPHPLCAAGSPPLPDSSNRYVHSQTVPASSAAGMPRPLAALLVFVHYCKFVVRLAVVVRGVPPRVGRSLGPGSVARSGISSSSLPAPSSPLAWPVGGPCLGPRCARGAA